MCFVLSMHACSTSSCLPAEIIVDCSYVLVVKASLPDVEMARLVALRYGGESESVPGCLFDGTGTLYRLFSVTRKKSQSNDHVQGKPLFSEGIPWARALFWEIKAINLFYAVRLRRTLSNDVPEQLFFFVFFHFRNSFNMLMLPFS